ncbi:hypothetical protein [Streptomyces olivaceus]|uniref:hypothetical protein n=1 Tax=Streptomyces olivaceus TaxID=47716 RepID=UPI0036AF082B
MAEFSAPFDGSPITTQVQWSRVARRWGLDGVHAQDPTSTALKVTGSATTTVTVGPGHAFVNGFYYYLDAAKTLTVTANAGGAARVDLVVLRADMAAKKVTAEYKTGGTTAPTLTQVEDGVWEIPLAQCTVSAGSSVVTAANTVDRRYLTGRAVLPAVAGARPPAVKNQLLIEDGQLHVGDGAAWRWLAGVGVQESWYTPVWSAGEWGLGWGAASVNVGHYQVVGRRVDLTIQLQVSGNPAGFPDPIQVTLPPGLPAHSTHRAIFTWLLESNNGEGQATGAGVVFPTVSPTRIARLIYPTSNGNTTSSVPGGFSLRTNFPYNIRSGDILTIDGSYWTP